MFVGNWWELMLDGVGEDRRVGKLGICGKVD
jgi:hypothetical protein